MVENIGPKVSWSSAAGWMAFAGFELFTATLLFAGVLFAGVLAIGPAQAAEAGAAPDGLKMLKLFGDFRLRFESDWDSKRANGTEREDRSRLRIRARFGARIDPNPYVSFGVRLRTGSRESQQSPHFTISDFSGNATGPKSVVFDKWYAKVKYEGVSAWGGRNSFPFWKQNELFWDDDATPAGLAVRYNRPVGGGKLTVNGGYLALADGMELFNGYLGAGQLVYSAEVGGAKLTAAGGGFFFDGTNGSENLRNGNGARDYTIWVGNLQAKTKLGPVPVKVGFDVMHNSEDYSSTDPNAFTAANHDETDGYVANITFGKLKERGDWLAAYYYAYIETFAVNASYAQDDWMRWGSATQTDGSDFKGHEFRVAVALAKNVNLLARLYVIEAITSVQDGNRFRLDFNWKY